MKLMQEQGTLQLQNHMWWFKRWANELAMICQRFTHVECFEVQISIAQANGTQGLIPPSVIKINTMTITGELKRRVEGRTALIKLSEVINTLVKSEGCNKLGLVDTAHFSRAPECTGLGFGTALCMLLLLHFSDGPWGCWLLTASTPLGNAQELLNTQCRPGLFPRKGKAVLWFNFGGGRSRAGRGECWDVHVSHAKLYKPALKARNGPSQTHLLYPPRTGPALMCHWHFVCWQSRLTESCAIILCIYLKF